MQSLLNQHDFFKTLFEVLPSPVMLVDIDYRVIAINAAGQRFFDMNHQDAYLQVCGKVFRCVHANEPGGCGQTQFCNDCLIRYTVGLSLGGQEVMRNKGGYHIWLAEELTRVNVLITTTRLLYANQVFALVIIEEISNITELQGLLPICCSCHRILDKQEGWTRLEEYIEKHSEADFTHDFCPECVERERLRVKKAAR